MDDRTRALWAGQDRHPGDRHGLYEAVASAVRPERVLYPGSYVDLAPSFVFPSVVYVDTDDRAARFFADRAGVLDIVASTDDPPSSPDLRYLHGDYAEPLDLEDESFDLLISLYAGFVSEHCTRYLRPGGTLLANPSHGDAALASIDPRYRLTGAVTHRAGRYRVLDDDLDLHLVPKRPMQLTPALLHERGRGIAYTRPAFAYLFERVA